MAESESCEPRYLIVRAERGGLLDLFKFLVSYSKSNEFIERSEGGLGPISGDHRWVIVVSIIVRRILAILGKPMQWNGVAIEFFLNLLGLNGGIYGLFLNLIKGDLPSLLAEFIFLVQGFVVIYG